MASGARKRLSLSVSGGTPPYTYNWQEVSGPLALYCLDSTVKDPVFATNMAVNTTGTATWKVTVTDSLGANIEHTVPIQMQPVNITLAGNRVIECLSGSAGPYSRQANNETPTGETGPYTYKWVRNPETGNFTDSNIGDVVPLNQGTVSTLDDVNVLMPTLSANINANDKFAESWQLIITDANGLQKIVNYFYVFRQYTALTVTVPTATTVDDYVGSISPKVFNKTITATGHDGVGNISYLWEPMSSQTLDPDPHYNDVVVLLHLDGPNNSTTITDVKGNAVTKVGSPKLNNLQTKFGTSSLDCNTLGSAVVIEDHTLFDFATSFTIDGWFYNAGGGGYIFNIGGIDTVDTAAVSLRLESDVLKVFIASTPGGGGQADCGIVVRDTWNHFEVSWNGTYYKVFLNGVMMLDISSAAKPYTPTHGLVIGNYPSAAWNNFPTDYPDIYLNEIRITNNVARHTANFTVPTTKYYDDIGVSGVSNSTAFVGENTATLDIEFSVLSSDSVQEMWKCTATDAVGHTATTTHKFQLSASIDPSVFNARYQDVLRHTNGGDLNEVWADLSMGITGSAEWVNAYIVPNLLPTKTIDWAMGTDYGVLTIGSYHVAQRSITSNQDHQAILDSNDVKLTTLPAGPTTGTYQAFDSGGVPITGVITVNFTIDPLYESNEMF